jgi:predicted DsbA family dithiol-disulfide isomerase
MTPSPVLLHWFDFICPFCYVAQDRNRILRDAALTVIDQPFQIHPEIGPGGVPAPTRTGRMYEQLDQAAREAGLALSWAPRIPSSRYALAAAESVRIEQPEASQAFNAAVFRAYFARGEDIEDPAVIAACAGDVGIDPLVLGDRMASGVAEDELREAEATARAHHVTGTPSWLVDDQLVVGLRPRAFFLALASMLSSEGGGTDDASTGHPR